MGARASVARSPPPLPRASSESPPQRSALRCTVSTWPGTGADRDFWPAAVVYDPCSDAILVAAGVGGSSRLARVFVYRFDADGADAGVVGDEAYVTGSSSSSSASSSPHRSRPRARLQEISWPIIYAVFGFAHLRRLPAPSPSPSSSPSPALSPSLSPLQQPDVATETEVRRECCLVAHDNHDTFTIGAIGDDEARHWQYMLSPRRMYAIAVDSLGLIVHLEKSDKSTGVRDALYLHMTGVDSAQARLLSLTPPYKSPTGNGGCSTAAGDERHWDDLLAIAFGADDRLYVLDREPSLGKDLARERSRKRGTGPSLGVRRCRLYRSGGPIPSDAHYGSGYLSALGTLSSEPLTFPVVFALPCEWSVVADLTDAFSDARFATDDPMCLAVDAFRCRAYLANAMHIHVIQLASSDGRGVRCDDYRRHDIARNLDGQFGDRGCGGGGDDDSGCGGDGDASGCGGGGGDSCGCGGGGGGDDCGCRGGGGDSCGCGCGCGCGSDRGSRTGENNGDRLASDDMHISGAHLLVGDARRQGSVDGPGAASLFASIRGCAIRTRPVDARLDVAPVLAAIRDSDASRTWPPGVPELVEQYARGAGRPAASLVVSDHGNRCIREIELLD